jgi:hypothetical protein
MPRTQLSVCNRPARAARWRFRPRVEPLERRLALAAGVTCHLIDGDLQIYGTAAEDAVAVRYDAEAAMIEVHGEGEGVVGEFPLAQVERLSLAGLAADDQFLIDSRIALPIAIAPAGEATSGRVSECSSASRRGCRTGDGELAANLDPIV